MKSELACTAKIRESYHVLSIQPSMAINAIHLHKGFFPFQMMQTALDRDLLYVPQCCGMHERPPFDTDAP